MQINCMKTQKNYHNGRFLGNYILQKNVQGILVKLYSTAKIKTKSYLLYML